MDIPEIQNERWLGQWAGKQVNGETRQCLYINTTLQQQILTGGKMPTVSDRKKTP